MAGVGKGLTMTTRTATITIDEPVTAGGTIRAHWDSQDANSAGWYAEARDESGEYLDDSQKIWWPVDLDGYGEDDADDVRDALAEAFPAATIEVL